MAFLLLFPLQIIIPKRKWIVCLKEKASQMSQAGRALQ